MRMKKQNYTTGQYIQLEFSLYSQQEYQWLGEVWSERAAEEARLEQAAAALLSGWGLPPLNFHGAALFPPVRLKRFPPRTTCIGPPGSPSLTVITQKYDQTSF